MTETCSELAAITLILSCCILFLGSQTLKLEAYEAVKAHYRVGLAYLARDEFELAKAHGSVVIGRLGRDRPLGSCEDALTSAHEIEPSNPDIAAALKQLKKNMEDYKTRRRNSHADGSKESSFNYRGCLLFYRSAFSQFRRRGERDAFRQGTGTCCRRAGARDNYSVPSSVHGSF